MLTRPECPLVAKDWLLISQQKTYIRWPVWLKDDHSSRYQLIFYYCLQRGERVGKSDISPNQQKLVYFTLGLGEESLLGGPEPSHLSHTQKIEVDFYLFIFLSRCECYWFESPLILKLKLIVCKRSLVQWWLKFETWSLCRHCFGNFL